MSNQVVPQVHLSLALPRLREGERVPAFEVIDQASSEFSGMRSSPPYGGIISAPGMSACRSLRAGVIFARGISVEFGNRVQALTIAQKTAQQVFGEVGAARYGDELGRATAARLAAETATQAATVSGNAARDLNKLRDVVAASREDASGLEALSVGGYKKTADDRERERLVAEQAKGTRPSKLLRQYTDLKARGEREKCEIFRIAVAPIIRELLGGSAVAIASRHAGESARFDNEDETGSALKLSGMFATAEYERVTPEIRRAQELYMDLRGIFFQVFGAIAGSYSEGELEQITMNDKNSIVQGGDQLVIDPGWRSRFYTSPEKLPGWLPLASGKPASFIHGGRNPIR